VILTGSVNSLDELSDETCEEVLNSDGGQRTRMTSALSVASKIVEQRHRRSVPCRVLINCRHYLHIKTNLSHTVSSVGCVNVIVCTLCLKNAPTLKWYSSEL